MSLGTSGALRQSPLISVIVTSFGKERPFLPEALESIRTQTISATQFELVVVADVPEPPNFQASFKCFATWIRANQQWLGQYLWIGLQRSSGDIICFLDDDDSWQANRLARVADCFLHDPNLSYYQNPQEVINTAGKPGRSIVGSSLRGVGRRRETTISVSPEMKLSMVRTLKSAGADFNLSSIAIRRKDFELFLPAIRAIRSGPDLALFYAALAARGSLLLDHCAYTRYRLGSRSRFRRSGEPHKSGLIDRKIFRYGLWVEDLGQLSKTVAEVGRADVALLIERDILLLRLIRTISVTDSAKSREIRRSVSQLLHGDYPLLSPSTRAVCLFLGLTASLSPSLAKRAVFAFWTVLG